MSNIMRGTDKEVLMDCERAVAVLSEMFGHYLLMQMTENRIDVPVFNEESFFKEVGRLIPHVNLTREEFQELVIPILKEVVEAAERCKDTLPQGVLIKRKYITYEEGTDKVVRTRTVTESCGTYLESPEEGDPDEG